MTTESNQNWQVVQLKDLCERITKGSTPTSYGYKYTTEGIRFIKAENIDSAGIASSTTDFIDTETHQFLKRSILRESDILFSIAGTIGRVGLLRATDIPANTNQALAIIRLKPDAVDHRYLFYFLRSDSIQKKALKEIVGVGRANLSLENIGEFQVPIAPLDQQKQIVAEIEKQFSRLDEAVANLKRVKANLKRYKAAVLKAAVEGKLTEEWRETHPNSETGEELLNRFHSERRKLWEEKKPGKYTEPVTPDITNLTELPKGWVWATLSTLLVDIEAGKSFKCDERPPTKEEVGVVKVSAVTWGEFDETESKTCLDRKLIKESLLIRAGDFLFSRANTIELVGACVIAKGVTNNLMLSDKILRFRLLGGLDQWVLYNLRSKFGRQEIERLATGNQESMRNIGQDRIRAIRIPLPPIEESRQIVVEIERRFSIVDEVEAQVGSDLKRAERLRQAVLMKAFAGQLLNHDNAESIETLNVSAPSCA